MEQGVRERHEGVEADRLGARPPIQQRGRRGEEGEGRQRGPGRAAGGVRLGRSVRHGGGGSHAADYTAAMSAPAASSATASAPAPVPVSGRVAALSYFFPAHNEAENIEALVDEALRALPALADEFEIIAVDDGSRDGTAAIADRLASEQPGGSGSSTTPSTADTARPCGAASRRPHTRSSRSPMATASSVSPTCPACWRVQKLRTCPTSWSAFACDAPTRPSDWSTHAPIASACASSSASKVSDVDCACKLFRRDALEGIRLESGGAFLSAELLIKVRARGRSMVEVGMPHYPRTAGQASGANPRVVLRAVRDFWRLRLRLWFQRSAAMQRGEPVLDQGDGVSRS